MKWPMKPQTLTTSTREAFNSVQPTDCHRREKPSEAGNPPASAFNRCIGGASWHGFALHSSLTPVACKSFPNLFENTLAPLATIPEGSSRYRAN